LLVAVLVPLGRKGESETWLKLEREDVSIALIIKGAALAVEIVNPTRSTQLWPPDMDKRTPGRRKRPWGGVAVKNEVSGRKNWATMALGFF
jgi:hypothetical protein